MQSIPECAAEIGRQLARLSRSIANAGGNGELAPRGLLQPPFGNLEMSDWLRSIQLWREHGRVLIRQQPSRSCPSCEGTEHRLLFNSFDDYPYVDCLACGTWYIPYVVDEALFDAYYARCPEAYEIVVRFTAQRLEAGRAESDRVRMDAYFAEVEPLLTDGARTYLDVGCGVGHSLEVASDRGWTACGVDTSPSIIEAGRKRGFNIVHPNDLERDTSFSLVSLWETLEHLNDPFGVLSAISPRLDEDGLLAITIPNLQALEARLMRQDVAWINGGAGFGTVHINLFQPSSVEHLLGRAGLRVIGWDGQYGCNTYELASYMLGRHRGAWDYARGVKVEHNLSNDALAFLNWISPAWAVLSRQLLMTPILKVMVSKTKDENRLAKLRSEYASAKRLQILAAIDAAYPEA